MTKYFDIGRPSERSSFLTMSKLVAKQRRNQQLTVAPQL